MALKKISTSNGVEAARQRLNLKDPGKSAYNVVFGEPGKMYSEAPTLAAEGTVKKLIEGHNDYIAFKEVMQQRPF